MSDSVHGGNSWLFTWLLLSVLLSTFTWTAADWALQHRLVSAPWCWISTLRSRFLHLYFLHNSPHHFPLERWDVKSSGTKLPVVWFSVSTSHFWELSKLFFFLMCFWHPRKDEFGHWQLFCCCLQKRRLHITCDCSSTTVHTYSSGHHEPEPKNLESMPQRIKAVLGSDLVQAGCTY